MNLERTAVVYFLSRVLLTVSGFVASFAIARFLGPEILGIYSVVIAVMYWFSIPVHAVTYGMLKRMSEGTRTGQFFVAGTGLVAIITAILSLGLILSRSWIDAYIGAPLTIPLVALIATNAFYLVVKWGLHGQNRVGSAAILDASERIVRTSIHLGVIYLGAATFGLVLGHTGALLLTGVVGIVLYKVRPAMPSVNDLRRVIDYAKYSIIKNVEGKAFGWMDTLVLAFFVSSSLIGIYEIAWSLASTLALASQSIQRTLFPTMSRLDQNDESERIRTLLEMGLVYSGILAVPGLFGAAIIGPELLSVYRPAFARGSTVLLILIVARLLDSYRSQLLSALDAVDRPRITHYISAVAFVVNVILNVTLVLTVGWTGAAVATAVTAGVTLGLSYYALARELGVVSVPVAELTKQVFAAAVMSAGLIPLTRIGGSSEVVVIALVLAGGVMYFVTLNVVSEEVRTRTLDLVSTAG